MNRLFRHSKPGVTSYVALVIFAAAYLSALALVLAAGVIWRRTGGQQIGCRITLPQ